MADANELILTQILGELEKLNAFERQQANEVRNLKSVATGDQQTSIAPALQRNTFGLYTPGAISTNASTPELVNRTQLAEEATQELSRTQNQQATPTISGDTTANDRVMSEEAVAWSLLGEAGVGGPLGRIRQTQYAVNRNLDYLRNGVNRAQDTLDVSAINSTGAGGSPSTFNRAAATALKPIDSVFGALQKYEVPVTLGYMALRGGAVNIQDRYEAGAALGYGDPGAFSPFGVRYGQEARQMTAQREGQALFELQKQLQRGIGLGLPTIRGIPEGLRAGDAQALIEQLAGQGFSPDPLGAKSLGATGNLANITRGLAPSVSGMGAQGPEIVANWTSTLRSANESIQNLDAQLQQFPVAARTAQMGLQGFNQSLLEVAQAVEGMGGSQPEGMQMGLNFEALHPGLSPSDMTPLLHNPIFQAMGLSRGVLPSGIPALGGGAINQMTQQTVDMMFSAFQGIAPPQQYANVNGRKVPLNDPQAFVAQQVSSMLGISPQDLLRMRQDSRNPQTNSRAQIEDYLGQNLPGGARTGLLTLLGPSTNRPDQWNKLSKRQQQDAQQYWEQYIAPNLSASGIDPQHVRALERDPNIARRYNTLTTKDGYLFGANKSGPGGANNASTAQLQISLDPNAAKIFNLHINDKTKATNSQNAGGKQLNLTLNSHEGQNPSYSSLYGNSGANSQFPFGNSKIYSGSTWG